MESLNFIGLIKAAAGKEVDWSAPDANYNSPFLVAGMRLTPEQNAAYDEYKAMYGRAKARKWLKQNYGKTGRTQTVNTQANPTSTMDPASTRRGAGVINAQRPTGADYRAARTQGRTIRSRVGGNKPSRRVAKKPAVSAPSTMDVSGMSDQDVMTWVQNHASEINNKWYSDPYYQNMARRVAQLQDPHLFQDAKDPVYGVSDDALNLRVQNLFQNAAKPYARMVSDRSNSPTTSGGLGYRTRGR